MKRNLKISAIAAAVAMFAMGTAAAGGGETTSPNVNVNINDNTTRNYNEDISLSADVNLALNADVDLALDLSRTESHNVDTSYSSSESHSVDTSYSSDESHRVRTNEVSSNIVRNETGNTDIRSERDEHGVSVNIDKSLSLNSDISFSGDPTLSGDIEIDSAAIALIDNRQSNTDNLGLNELLENDASIGDDVGSAASGNLQFNVAAGDNNVQDNAAALSAADASFAFGLADAEIFVNQYGAGNVTMNEGVTNAASMSGNAFSDASGNIGVNVASGNNNQQKNALAASVATSAYAQASVSSNQISTGNMVSNAGYVEERTSSIDVALDGTVSGFSLGAGVGAYEGTSQGSYAGTGNAYQSSNFYADMWEGELHPAGPVIGHADFDIDSQGAVANPYRDGVGGLGFDTEEEGTYQGSESGELAFLELSYSDLQASMAGTVATTEYVVVNATNTASLSGSAFSNASGNIGVNLAAGSGNLQANSLSMAVAQPSTGGTPPNGGGGE